MWQQANIKAIGLGDTRLSTDISKNNPVIALDVQTHKAVDTEQRAWDPRGQTPVENIRSNARVLVDLDVAPVRVIRELEGEIGVRPQFLSCQEVGMSSPRLER